MSKQYAYEQMDWFKNWTPEEQRAYKIKRGHAPKQGSVLMTVKTPTPPTPNPSPTPVPPVEASNQIPDWMQTPNSQTIQPS